MSDDGYVGATGVAVLQDLLARLREALEDHREEYHRSMLESWTDEDVELPEDREELEAKYREVYADRDLTSEDWEARDYQSGWEYGFGAAQQILVEMLDELERR